MFNYQFNLDHVYIPFTENEFITACDKFLEYCDGTDLGKFFDKRCIDDDEKYNLIHEYYFRSVGGETVDWKDRSNTLRFVELLEDSVDHVSALVDLMEGDYDDMLTEWLPDGYDMDDPEEADEAINEYLFDKYMDED